MVVLLALAAAARSQDREVELLALLLQAPDEQLRFSAAMKLAELGERAVPALLARLDDPWPDFRESACNSLEELGGPGAAAAGKLAAIAEKDDFADVRTAALHALARVDPARALPLVRKGLADPEEDARWTAEWAVKLLPPAHALAFLKHDREAVRAAAREALADADPPPLDAVVALLKEGSADAARVLDAWDARALPALDALLDAARSERADVAAAALDALADLPSAGQRATQAAVAALQRPEEEVRASAAYVLLQPGLGEASALAAALRDPSARVRRLAWLGLRDTDDPAAAAALQARLDDPELHLAAAHSLWRTKGAAEPYLDALRRELERDAGVAHAIAEMGPAGKPAVPDLVAAAGRTEDIWDRAAIAEALIAVGAPEKAWSILVETYENDEDNPLLVADSATGLGAAFLAARIVDGNGRGLAGVALGDLGPEAAATAAALLFHEDEEVRREACWALVSLEADAEPAVPALLAALGSPDDHVRWAATRALGAAAEPGDEDVLAALRVALEREADAEQRVVLASALSALGAPPEEVVPVLVACLPDEDAAWEARVTLAALGSDAVPLLRPYLERREVRFAVAAAMAAAGADPALVTPVLKEAIAAGETEAIDVESLGPAAAALGASGLGHESAEVRLYCVRVLAARVGLFVEDDVLGAESAARTLAPLLADPSAEVREEVRDLLVKLGPLAAPAVPRLIAGLDGPERRQVAPVLTAIGRPAKAAAPHLARLIREDEDVHVRLAAIGAMGSLGKEAGEHTAVLWEVLKSDPDERIRFVAAHAAQRHSIESGAYAIGVGGGR